MPKEEIEKSLKIIEEHINIIKSSLNNVKYGRPITSKKQKILKMINSGVPYKKIAKVCKVSYATVYNVYHKYNNKGGEK